MADSKTDILEKLKKVSAFLDEDDSRPKLLLDNTIIVIANKMGEIQLVGGSIYLTFGYHTNELVGSSITVLMEDSKSALHSVAFRNYQSGNIAESSRVNSGAGLYTTGIHKDGTPIALRIYISTIHNAHEKLTMAIIRKL